jgi:hypothetical protein
MQVRGHAVRKKEKSSGEKAQGNVQSRSESKPLAKKTSKKNLKEVDLNHKNQSKESCFSKS